MKLILAIVSNDDSAKVSSALTKNHFSVTKLATTGGFLLSGNTTFLIGTQDEKVDEVITIIADHSKKRKQMVPSSASYGVGMYTTYPPLGVFAVVVDDDVDVDRDRKSVV